MKFKIICLNKDALHYAAKNNKYEIIYYLLTKRKYLKKEIFKDESKLRRVMIPPTITSIGEKSFYCCSSLIQVSIPSSVTSIGLNAFNSCLSLKQISIHSQIKSIDEFAFGYCKSLTKVIVHSFQTKINGNAFSFCPLLKHIDFPFLDKHISEYEHYERSDNFMRIIIMFLGKFG